MCVMHVCGRSSHVGQMHILFYVFMKLRSIPLTATNFERKRLLRTFCHPIAHNPVRDKFLGMNCTTHSYDMNFLKADYAWITILRLKIQYIFRGVFIQSNIFEFKGRTSKKLFFKIHISRHRFKKTDIKNFLKIHKSHVWCNSRPKKVFLCIVNNLISHYLSKVLD